MIVREVRTESQHAENAGGLLRLSIAAGGEFYNVQPGTAAQYCFKVEDNNKS